MKPKYQNEDLMAALSIKTEKERHAYNQKLINEANGFTEDEVEGHYRCMWGLTTEEDDYKCRMNARAYRRRLELFETLPDRLIITSGEKRRFLRNRKRAARMKAKMLRDVMRESSYMSEKELEEQVYQDAIWFEEKLKEHETEVSQ